jgi:hypothetical protein
LDTSGTDAAGTWRSRSPSTGTASWDAENVLLPEAAVPPEVEPLTATLPVVAEGDGLEDVDAVADTVVLGAGLTATVADPAGLVTAALAVGVVAAVIPVRTWPVVCVPTVALPLVPASVSMTVAGVGTAPPPVMVTAAATPPLRVTAMSDASALWGFNTSCDLLVLRGRLTGRPPRGRTGTPPH